MSYKLKLEIYEGPLDLLLYLIKKNDINIYDIPIAMVTEQYLAYIELMKILNLDIVGDFLVMASELIKIKSKMLLPPDPTQEEEELEDPRNELVKRLLEYKQFNEIAEELQRKEALRQDLYSRQIDLEKLDQIREEAQEVYFEASLFDLIHALTAAIQRVPEEVFYEIFKDEHTVEEKVHQLLHLLMDYEQLNVQQLFAKAVSKLEIIVIFLAILELIRLKEIKVVQKRMFGDILVIRNREHMVAGS